MLEINNLSDNLLSAPPPQDLVVDHLVPLVPRVKDIQLPRLGKPRRGLQIFDTRVDFPVPVQSGGRFY